MNETGSTNDLIEQVNEHNVVEEPDDVPEPLVKVLEYIESNTGLLDDYNDAKVALVDGGKTIQWYPRKNNAGSHSGILRWLQQPEQQDIAFNVIKTRNEDLYIELIPSERAGIEQLE